jgi:hypothetical protein
MRRTGGHAAHRLGDSKEVAMKKKGKKDEKKVPKKGK